MKPDRGNFDLLFDGNEYYQSGFCPWTFFAYPTSLDVEKGLPLDDDARRLLTDLQNRGIDIAIWVNGIADDTTYFACRKGDIQRLNEAFQELKSSGVIEKNFCGNRTERLFAKLAEGTEPTYEREPEEAGSLRSAMSTPGGVIRNVIPTGQPSVAYSNTTTDMFSINGGFK